MHCTERRVIEKLTAKGWAQRRCTTAHGKVGRRPHGRVTPELRKKDVSILTDGEEEKKIP
jgi:hypothetical protein